MNIVNLTPHVLNVLNEQDEEVLTLEPSGAVARVDVDYVKVGELCGAPLYNTKYGDVQGVQAPQEGTYQVVSGMVKSTMTDREDVLSPGSLLRDEDGKPMGCLGFKVG